MDKLSKILPTDSLAYANQRFNGTVTKVILCICRYGRDYYINESKFASGGKRPPPQVCGLHHLEQEALHRNVYRNSFRASNSSSPNFTVNPLFVPDKAEPEVVPRQRVESGYSSSIDSLDTNLLRLVPPSEPQMVERSLEPLSSIRRSESLRSKGEYSQRRAEWGGSLRLNRGNDKSSFW